jgi:hypothetical protein
VFTAGYRDSMSAIAPRQGDSWRPMLPDLARRIASWRDILMVDFVRFTGRRDDQRGDISI